MGEQIILAVQRMTNGFFDGLFIFFTLFGEELFFILAVAAIYWCVSKRFAFHLTLVYMASALVNYGIKNIVQEPRPQNVRKLWGESAGGYSFPSGHAQSASAYISAISGQYFSRKVWGIVTGLLLILLVCLSRIYLGHHYLHDVVAGAVIGYAIGWFGSKLMEKVRMDTRWYLLLLVPGILLLCFSHSSSVYKAVGGGISLIAGYILEERFVKSGNPKGAWVAVLRLVIGFGIAAGLYFGLAAIGIDNKFWDLAVFTLLGLWISLLAPMVFKQIEKRIPARGNG